MVFFKPSALSLFFIFLFTFSCEQKKKDVVSSGVGYEENLTKMKKKTIYLVKHLSQYKIREDEKRRLICYFSTDNEHAAGSLSAELAKLEYAVDAGEYSGDKAWVINAKTKDLQMNEETLLNWVEEMVKLSHENGCVMEGWSVAPKAAK